MAPAKALSTTLSTSKTDHAPMKKSTGSLQPTLRLKCNGGSGVPRGVKSVAEGIGDQAIWHSDTPSLPPPCGGGGGGREDCLTELHRNERARASQILLVCKSRARQTGEINSSGRLAGRGGHVPYRGWSGRGYIYIYIYIRA